MEVFTEVLSGLGGIAFLVAIAAVIMFIIGYVPSFVRSPSPLGRTVLGGKFALLLLASSSVTRHYLGSSPIVHILQFAAIASVAVWLVYDYLIMRHIQNRGKHIAWWRRFLPVDNLKK